MNGFRWLTLDDCATCKKRENRAPLWSTSTLVNMKRRQERGIVKRLGEAGFGKLNFPVVWSFILRRWSSSHAGLLSSSSDDNCLNWGSCFIHTEMLHRVKINVININSANPQMSLANVTEAEHFLHKRNAIPRSSLDWILTFILFAWTFIFAV